jgi:hypothetical protein
MENVPSNIDFARKQPKAKDEFENKNERSLEAPACPILHASMIKFWALYSNTMEAYTLWWNGGSLKSFGVNAVNTCTILVSHVVSPMRFVL